MPSSHSFELSDATLSGEYLDVSGTTMFFVDSAAEADFLRFRNRGRVAVVIATMAIHVPFYTIFALTANNNLSMFSAAAVALVTTVLQISLVACRRPTSIAEETAVARLQERIPVVGMSAIILVVAGTYPLIGSDLCAASYPDRPRADCIYASDAAAAMLSVNTLALAPRLVFLGPMNGLAVACFSASTLAFGFFPEPLDYVLDALVSLGFMAAFCLGAWAIEVRQRDHFRSVVLALRADLIVAREAADTRAVLSAVLPSPLLREGAVDAAHHRRASVVITDIYNFAQWSTGYLEVDVVFILHALIAGYDAAVDANERVERAMSYGDRYVVCAGLLEAAPEHRNTALEFAQQLLAVAARVTAGMKEAKSFAVRGAVYSGALVGGTVGTDALRYVVAGPAFDAAQVLLQGCAPGAIAVGADADDTGAAPSIGAAPLGDAVPDSRSYGLTAPSSGSDVDYGFSAVWLKFSDASLQLKMDTAADDCVANALVPAIVIAAVAVGVLIELSLPSPRRHHTRQPAGFALLLLSLALSWAHVALLKLSPEVWGRRARFNVAVAFATQAAFGAGLALIDCYFAEPSGVAFIALWVLRRVAGVSWLAQTALFVAGTFLPAFYYDLYVNAFFGPSRVFTTFVVAPVLFVAFRYFAARAACQQFAAQDVAQASLLNAASKGELLERLLTGLMPEHVPHSARYQTQVVPVGRPSYIELWRNLSVLQIHVAFPDASRGFRGVAAAWNSVTGNVGAVCAALELVQATGDSFLIAGPFRFGVDDAAAVEAARGSVNTLRAIADALARFDCLITTVASAGNAFGTLVGAALLTYRIFGAAVRENDAIMAAAPRVPQSHLAGDAVPRSDSPRVSSPRGKHRRNVVFLAANSFVQQERNFVVPHVSTASDGGMSTVVAPDASVTVLCSDGVSQDTASPSHTVRPPSHHRATFAPPMLWRVRGLGVTSVSTVSEW
jgi:hypothetical protein